MRFGPLGIWEILVIVGVALLIFGPTQLPKIARGVGKAFKSAKDFKDEMTGAVLDDEAPRRRSVEAAQSKPAEDPTPGEKTRKTTDPTA